MNPKDGSPIRLALYARVSSTKQREEGTIASQVDVVRAYASELGANVVRDGDTDVFADDGVSGESLDRPAMTRLRARLATGEIDAVCVYDIDRLSRDTADQYQLVWKELLGRGLSLYLAKTRSRFEDDDNGRVLFAVFSLQADLGRRKISENAARGMEHRARVEGRMNGGFARFGYSVAPCDCGANRSKSHTPTCSEGRLIVNQDEAVWVRPMSGWLLNDGLKPGEIAQRLQALQVPTRYEQRLQQRQAQGDLSVPIRRSGSPRVPCSWYPDHVRSILTDDLYAGKFTYRPKGGEPVVMNVPPILDAATVEAHRAAIARNKSLRRRQDGDQHLLRGLVVCGSCGRRYVAASDGRDPVYRCGTWKYPKALRDCTNRNWSARKLEAAVWDRVVQLIRDPDQVLADMERLGHDSDQPRLRLEMLERRLKVLDVEDGRVREGFRLGIFTVEQARAEYIRSDNTRAVLRKEIDGLHDELQANLEAQQRAEAIRSLLSMVQDPDALTRDERQRFLRSVVTRITVHGLDVEAELILRDPSHVVGPVRRPHGTGIKGPQEG